MPENWIAIGKIVRAIGLDGRCGILAFGNGFASLEPPCSVRLAREGETGRDARIERIGGHPGGFQCHFEGVADRTAAELLRGLLVYVGEESLPALAENEFYQHDLKEMLVLGDTDGALLGRVLDVHEMPSMVTIEVLLEKGGSVMLPFTAQAVERVDAAARRIIVRESFVEELLE